MDSFNLIRERMLTGKEPKIIMRSFCRAQGKTEYQRFLQGLHERAKARHFAEKQEGK